MTRRKYIAVGSAGVFRKVGLLFRMMRAFSERIASIFRFGGPGRSTSVV